MTPDNWIAGDAYELFMGRWSRMVAEEFIQWLSPSASWHWLEMGCGTGALTQVILSRTSPAYLIACDLSPQFVSFIRGSINHPSIDFLVADAADLPLAHDVFDVVVSGLVLNFFPTPIEAIRSLRSRLHPGGKLAAYVWDYAEVGAPKHEAGAPEAGNDDQARGDLLLVRVLLQVVIQARRSKLPCFF